MLVKIIIIFAVFFPVIIAGFLVLVSILLMTLPFQIIGYAIYSAFWKKKEVREKKDYSMFGREGSSGRNFSEKKEVKEGKMEDRKNNEVKNGGKEKKAGPPRPVELRRTDRESGRG